MSAVGRALLPAALAGLLAVAAAPARAVDGVVEIDQACAAGPGCFPGDEGGFPVVITQPGSYRLTGPLQIGEVSAIEVHADHVTIDLNGFTIAGPATCTGTPVTSCAPSGGPAAIDATFPVPGQSSSHLTLRNGVVRGSAGLGVFLGDSSRLEAVTLEVNAGGGADLGASAEVIEVIGHRNGSYGIALFGGHVRNVVAVGNSGDGILAYGGSVSESVAVGNGDGGIVILGTSGSLPGKVDGVVASANLGGSLGWPGVGAQPGPILESVVRDNAATGMALDARVAYGRNVVVGNGGSGDVLSGHPIACNLIGGVRVCP